MWKKLSRYDSLKRHEIICDKNEKKTLLNVANDIKKNILDEIKILFEKDYEKYNEIIYKSIKKSFEKSNNATLKNLSQYFECDDEESNNIEL